MQRCKSNFYIVESYLKFTVKVSFQKTRSQIILQLSFSFDEPGDFLLMWEHRVGGYKIVQIACTKQNLSSLIIIEVHKNLTQEKAFQSIGRLCQKQIAAMSEMAIEWLHAIIIKIENFSTKRSQQTYICGFKFTE